MINLYLHKRNKITNTKSQIHLLQVYTYQAWKYIHDEDNSRFHWISDEITEAFLLYTKIFSS